MAEKKMRIKIVMQRDFFILKKAVYAEKIGGKRNDFIYINEGTKLFIQDEGVQLAFDSEDHNFVPAVKASLNGSDIDVFLIPLSLMA